MSLAQAIPLQGHGEDSFTNRFLTARNAFYNQPDYIDSTQREFQLTGTLPATYTWDTEYKIIRVVKQILSIIIFPISFYHLLHSLVGKVATLPASSLDGYSEFDRIDLKGDWKYKRIAIEVDGYRIDAMIVGKRNTLNNGRWVLASNGNAELYENKLCSNNDFKEILTKINGNGIVFNYPGVGSSSGLPNRYAMAKAYRAMLAFLEDKEKGIGASEIIGYGHSIGGGVQGEALKDHSLKQGVKYVFVKSRTFSDMSQAAAHLLCRPFEFLVKLLGWNIDSVSSSKKLQVPEIILQTADVQGSEVLEDSNRLLDDGIIAKDASLAKALLDGDKRFAARKKIVGIREAHNDSLSDANHHMLANNIEQMLASQG